MTRHQRHGFSLIELLVVTAVLALLLGVLLPSLKGARQQARRVACQSNLKHIATGIWNYWTDNDGRVPYVISPLTNGGSVPGYGNPRYSDAEVDPFDRQRWPMSLPNVLLNRHLAPQERIFVCPAAVAGWPRQIRPLRMTYRPAAANQPNGIVSPPGSYFRESFGILDGRQLKFFRAEYTDDPMRNAQVYAYTRTTYLRDFVKVQGPRIAGPHAGGINVVNRQLQVEYRDPRTTEADLNRQGSAVRF